MDQKFTIWILVVLLVIITPIVVIFGGQLILQSHEAITECGKIYPEGYEIVPESEVGSITLVEFSDLTDEQQRVFVDVIEGEDVSAWPDDRLNYRIRYQGDIYRIEYATSDCSGLYWGMMVLGGMLYLVVILSWWHAGPWVRRELSE